MADRRMFSKSIVLSDAFLDMPATTRCLYFTLNMFADDDGFVNSPKSIIRTCGASEDDLNVLCGKKFVIPFENGVIVIKHWRINNYLRCDRYKPTKYTEEKSELIVEENGSYRLDKSLEQVQTINNTPEKKGLLERVPKNDLEVVEKAYLENYEELYKSGVLKMDKPIINWVQSRKLTKDCIAKYGLETVVNAVKKSKDNAFCVEKGYCLTTILSAGVFGGLVNGTCTNKKGVVNEQFRAEEIVF